VTVYKPANVTTIDGPLSPVLHVYVGFVTPLLFAVSVIGVPSHTMEYCEAEIHGGSGMPNKLTGNEAVFVQPVAGSVTVSVTVYNPYPLK
jgi:hypothetical protein